jgi:hypothetical protein
LKTFPRHIVNSLNISYKNNKLVAFEKILNISFRAGAEVTVRQCATFAKMERIIAAPAPQHWLK